MTSAQLCHIVHVPVPWQQVGREGRYFAHTTDKGDFLVNITDILVLKVQTLDR